MSIRIISRLFCRQFPQKNVVSNYKSSLSLDKLYPASTLNHLRTPQIPVNEGSTFCGYIPMDKLQVSYSKSSGPGGQNVNKVNSKVDIRFELDKADWIPNEIRNNMKTKYKNQLTKEGFVVITSDRTRFQHYNLADALEKLRELIRAAEPEQIAAPSPETLERIRRRREKAARERLESKKTRSSIKGSRGSASASDL